MKGLEKLEGVTCWSQWGLNGGSMSLGIGFEVSKSYSNHILPLFAAGRSGYEVLSFRAVPASILLFAHVGNRLTLETTGKHQLNSFQ